MIKTYHSTNIYTYHFDHIISHAPSERYWYMYSNVVQQNYQTSLPTQTLFDTQSHTGTRGSNQMIQFAVHKISCVI